MRFIIFGTLFLLFMVQCGTSMAMTNPRGRKALQQLENYKEQWQNKITWIDTRLEKMLLQPGEIEKDLEVLRQLRLEYLLRLDLFNRLSLGVQSYYHGGDLNVFLVDYLRKTSVIELKNNQKNSLWKALLYMSRVVEKVPERFEDPIDFIYSYVEFSSLLNPKPPQEFVNQRNYTNGSEFQSGSAQPQDQIKVPRTSF